MLRIFLPKNPTASAGFEHANLGTRGQHANQQTTEAASEGILLTFGSHILEGGVLATPQVRSFMEPGDCLEPVTENQTLVFLLSNCFSEQFSVQQTFCNFRWMSEQTYVDLSVMKPT
jgi:hypothetical protein